MDRRIQIRSTYFQILEENPVTYGKRLINHNFMFKHDQDPKSIATTYNDLQQKNALQLMIWSSQSLDFNPIIVPCCGMNWIEELFAESLESRLRED